MCLRARAMAGSTYDERLAQALLLPLGPGRPLQALLRGAGAASNGCSQHCGGAVGGIEAWLIETSYLTLLAKLPIVEAAKGSPGRARAFSGLCLCEAPAARHSTSASAFRAD